MSFHIQLKVLLLVGAVIPFTIFAERPLAWRSSILKMDENWYAGIEAKVAAEQVISYQSEYGAWPKNWDLLQPISQEELYELNHGEKANTIDNGATTLPMRFLARMNQIVPEQRYRDAFIRGFDYLVQSQYENGGFPQFYPLRDHGYYSHVTYNDDAMISALELLREVADGDSLFSFVDEQRRSRAIKVVDKGIDCILKTQIRQNGVLAGWCAQYDEHTLKPAWARAYEPPSLSGGETVGIVEFLMSLEQPSPEVIAAIKGAVAWLEQVAIHGKRLVTVVRDDGREERWLEDDPDAPRLWARFYELVTDRPLYLDRDSVYRYDFSEIGYERRSGYGYHGVWAEKLLSVEYPRWCGIHGL